MKRTKQKQTEVKASTPDFFNITKTKGTDFKHFQDDVLSIVRDNKNFPVRKLTSLRVGKEVMSLIKDAKELRETEEILDDCQVLWISERAMRVSPYMSDDDDANVIWFVDKTGTNVTIGTEKDVADLAFPLVKQRYSSPNG